MSVPVPDERRERCAQLLLAQAKEPQFKLYALLDGARDERIRPTVTTSGLPWRCLFREPAAEELLAVAPYLVQLEGEDAPPFLHWMLDHGWGEGWGLFLRTIVPPDAVQRHLRSLLRVRDEDGRELFFRFYDPRVMRLYLPTLNEEEIRPVFGPMTAWQMESEDGGSLLVDRAEGARVVREEIPLGRGAAGAAA